MTKPVPDKAEVALEYPDKLYIGTFERSSRFDAHLDPAGISLTLERKGDVETRKSVHLHFHYALFADILGDLAATTSKLPADDLVHRDALRAGAEALYRSLSQPATDPKMNANSSCDRGGDLGKPDSNDVLQLTPKEAVLLLHVLE